MATDKKNDRHFVTTSDVTELCFPVEKVDFEEHFGIPANSDYSHAIIGVIDGQEKVLNVCSDRYNLLDNSSTFMYLENLLTNLGFEFEVEYEMVNHSVFTGKYTLKSRNGETMGFSVMDGDVIYPQITVRKSYNGLQKYAFMIGYYRLVCSNGLVIPVQEMKEFNFSVIGKHTKLLTENFENLESRIEHFMDAQEILFPRIEKLTQNVWIENYAERIEAVLTATKISMDGVGSAKNDELKGVNLRTITEIAEKESAKLDAPISDWIIYNAVNAYLYDNERNDKNDEVRRTKDTEVMSYLLSSIKDN